MPKSKSQPEKLGKLAKSSKKESFQNVKGMSDILPKDQDWWKTVARVGEEISVLYDFSYIETPLLEPAGLFAASIGVGTDIVEKEMYAFKTKGGEHVALRPEGTASVMRSYIQNHLGYFASPLKVYYHGPMFRYERQQAGRYRSFHQWGFEIIGDGDPIYDIHSILVTFAFLKALKIKTLKLKINTIGCRVCRPTYREKLKNYYKQKLGVLCKDCGVRYEKNILRLLDCKEPGCAPIKEKAPLIFDHLCAACNNHFKTVLELIEDNGIAYEPDSYLVRGLDYYDRTVFEVYAEGSDQALAGGGRYDYLAEMIGGRVIPAVGVALGIERIIDTMRTLDPTPQKKNKQRIFFAAVGAEAKNASPKLMDQLRTNGVIVVEALGKESLSAQLKIADRVKAPLALIYGQKEMFEESIIIRAMETGAQENIVISKMVEEVKRRLR